VTARGTDWSVALVVGVLAATGVLTAFAGGHGAAWVFAAHGIAGFGLAFLLWWKLRRVLRRLWTPRLWDHRTPIAVGALVLVAATLGFGFAWSSGASGALAGYTVLAWHEALGFGLALAVLGHAVVRAKRPRRRDVAGRRQLIEGAAIAGVAVGAWRLQRPLAALFGWEGAGRRFTGSYEKASFEGNAFPSTSWVADDPHELEDFTLEVGGRVAAPLSLYADELDAGDELTATLDCTGGFHSTQRWRGIRLDRLIARARPDDGADHLRVVSHTGYRWSFSLDEARGLLLATHVGGEPLSHSHGAPARLVAPGRRGFQWVKWVVRIELHDGPDYGALASTVWSSFTAEGRGDA
jgi:DMSO/TMAO reductase YedYZ molybdopterin-dependent catalytic subunit